jgi:hypothetical protein
MADRRAIHLKRVAVAGAAAERVHHDEALGVEVFRRPGKPSGVCELAFAGMRCKPDYAYRFATPEAAEAHRATWLAGKRCSADEKRARVEQRREASQQLAVGDVLVASWGYEQTNIDYYEVTRKVGARSVEIRELEKDTNYSGEAMAGACVPMKGRFVGLPMTKRVDAHGGVKVNHAHAVKKPSEIVGGVEVFTPDRFTTYA